MPGCRRKARRRCTRGSGRCRARARASGLVPRSFAYTRTRSRATGLDRRLYSWYMRRGIATDAAISVSARGVDVLRTRTRHRRRTPDVSSAGAPRPSCVKGRAVRCARAPSPSAAARGRSPTAADSKGDGQICPRSMRRCVPAPNPRCRPRQRGKARAESHHATHRTTTTILAARPTAPRCGTRSTDRRPRTRTHCAY